MKIIELTVENIKRVQAITIVANGQNIVLGGANEQGKTSTLDAIAMALGGGKLIPATPIRKGQKNARIEVDLGDMIVERRFTKTGSTLEVRPKDGGPKFGSPQAMLDKLFGNLSFDPLAFTGMKPADQLKTLKAIVGIDFTELDNRRLGLYEDRALTNREVKTLEAKVENLPKHPEAKARVDTQALLAELKQAEADNALFDANERETDTLLAQIAQYDTEIESLRARAIELKQKQSAMRERVGTLTSHGMKIDTQPITDSLINAQEVNDMVDANEKRRETETELRGKRMASEKLTLAIQDVDAQKEQVLAAASFPIAGLGFAEDGVLFNGIPFEQASEEQQIVVSAAMGAALNPKLKVLLVRKAALLDDKHFAALIEWGVEHDYQLWIERIKDGSECNVIISDGMVLEDRINDGKS